jgi:hypothetical protein
VRRSAVTGKAVSKEFAQKNPETTVQESKSKDTERLDWLESQQFNVSHDGKQKLPWWVVSPLRIFKGSTLRKAIDKGMKAVK